MTPCNSCGSHRRPGGRCPHCGSAPSPLVGASAVAIALALTAAACGTTQPLYGAPATDLEDPTPAEETAADDTSDTGQES